MSNAKNPIFRTSSLILIALSYSIGWGIRGNFGHEFGAMLAGLLAGVAVSLCSGREDWRNRTPYFAFFGALGCGFGGSIAYMPVMAYMQAEGAANQFYGFFATFMVGALWTGMGGVGMAYAAAEDRERMTAMFKPLCWIFALWTLQYFGEAPFAYWYEEHVHNLGADSSYFRQRGALYWLDSEWIEASLALIALCAFDLWNRRFSKFGWFVALGGAGCILGWGLQSLLTVTGLLQPLLGAVVHTQGNLTAIDPATGQPFDPADMITNWPIIFYDFSAYVGAALGIIVGFAIYFARFGEWRSGAKPLMYITVGSYLCFLTCPVLLSNLPFFKAVGGFRMMPPRGDSWANCVGAMLGALVYVWRYNLRSVALAGVVSFFLGGISLILATFLKVLVYIPGNPVYERDQSVIQLWAHWRSANWHSILTEQVVGFSYGIAIAVTMGLLVTRVKSFQNEQRSRKWTEGFSLLFLFNVLLYVNVVKSIRDIWTEERAGGFRSVPLSMKAPLFESLELSAWGWFNLVFIAIGICTVAAAIAHYRRPIAMIPRNWLGKGQLFFVLFLWAITLGNFMRILPGFHESRIATEGVIMVNALIATFMILFFPRDKEEVQLQEPANYWPLVKRWTIGGLIAFFAVSAVVETVNYSVYGFKDHGFSIDRKHNRRFGPEADWIVRPIIKSKEHR